MLDLCFYIPGLGKILFSICLLAQSLVQQCLGSIRHLHPVHWAPHYLGLLLLENCLGLTRRIDSSLDNSERNNSSNNLEINNTFLLARANTIKTFLMVGISFFICWVNDEVYYLMYNLGYDTDWNGIYFKFCVIMVFLNCTVNPFIYLIKYQDYQLALKIFLGCNYNKQNSRENVGHMYRVDTTASNTS